MRATEHYFAIVQQQLSAIANTQRPQIGTAADWLSECLQSNRFLYVFGSGHSHTLAEEVFYRAGGLARCVPILDEKLMVHESASASTEWERKEGYASEVLNRYSLGEGDLLVVVSNSGRNAVPIEMALQAKARGARAIAISSLAHGRSVSSRHSSGKKLCDVADVTIDNCGEPGDASLQIEGMQSKIGPTSTITSAFIINSIIAEAVSICVAAGHLPEIYASINSDHTGNEALLRKYKGVIPHL